MWGKIFKFLYLQKRQKEKIYDSKILDQERGSEDG